MTLRQRVTVVVVIVILAVGLGVVVEGIRRAREEAARTLCLNNLRQIGLALHLYGSWRGKFPPGTFFESALPVEDRVSWQFLLAPSMESVMGLPYEHVPAKGWRASENEFAVQHYTIIYRCPARPAPTNAPATNYVGISGLGRDAATFPLKKAGVGAFGYDRVTSTKDVKDGIENTMAAAETLLTQGHWAAGGHGTVRGLDRDDLPYLGGQFASSHPGINVLFLDGSVRSFNDQMAPAVFESLATIAGGEKVELFELQ